MDGHDYLDRSCFGNAESIEIFFDASRPDVYCSLWMPCWLSKPRRRRGRDDSLSAMSRCATSAALEAHRAIAISESVAIEISGIRDAAGSVPFIMNAVRLARNPMFAGCFHWGQFNPLTRPEVEKLYDVAPSLRLSRWRKSLRQLTREWHVGWVF